MAAPMMHITPAAAERVKQLVSARQKPTAGLRLAINSRGCSGLSYVLEYTDQPDPHAETIQVDGVNIYIDPKAIMFLIGTEMDYIEEDLESGFVFRNPNEKGRCGCGESFHV